MTKAGMPESVRIAWKSSQLQGRSQEILFIQQSRLISSIAAIYAVIEKLQGETVAGWTSVMIAIFFLGGVQMLSLGIIGEYIGKIYMESKNRPKFFIEEKAGGENEIQ